MVLKFFENLDSVVEYIEKEENEQGVKYIRRSNAKFFGSESECIAVFSSLFSQLLVYTVSGKKEATLFSTTTLAFLGRVL